MSAAAKSELPPLRLCIVATNSVSLRYLYRNQFEYLNHHNIQITAIASRSIDVDHLHSQPIRYVEIPICREPSPISDLVSMVRIWWFFMRNRFDVIHVSTPKAGLLGALAARLSFHKNLVYTLRGRVYENMSGTKRKIYNQLEWLVCRLSKRVYPINSELAATIVDEGISQADKVKLIGHGSSNGIDLDQYDLSPEKKLAATAFRASNGIPTDAIVIMCVGRIRAEKGINEATLAFEQLANTNTNIHLVLVGTPEPVDPLSDDVDEILSSHPRVHIVGRYEDPSKCYAAADIIAFPSYREGFGNVTLEAGAMKKPIVATDISGPRDVVVDGVSGFLVPIKQQQPLQDSLQQLIDDPQLRASMGEAGYEIVTSKFRQKVIWDGLIEEYRAISEKLF